MEQLNYYELLGVKENATYDEIKTAYKNQMKKWHPDINKDSNATTMSIALNEAKKTLLDENARRDYDRTLEEQRQKQYNQVFKKSEPKYDNSPKESKKETNSKTDEVYVSKWVYLKEWLQYGQASKLRKVLGCIGVLFESLLCKIIVFLLYAVSYICFYSTLVLQYLLSALGGMLLILFIFLCVSVLNNGGSIFSLLFIVIIVIGIIILLNFVPIFLLSPKVFDFLYNKFDIYLFKKCVGYPQ